MRNTSADLFGQGWWKNEEIGLFKTRRTSAWFFAGAGFADGQLYLRASGIQNWERPRRFMMKVEEPRPAPADLLPPGQLMATSAAELPHEGVHYRWEHKSGTCFMTMKSMVWGDYTLIGIAPNSLTAAPWSGVWSLYLVSPCGEWLTARCTYERESKEHGAESWFSEVADPQWYPVKLKAHPDKAPAEPKPDEEVPTPEPPTQEPKRPSNMWLTDRAPPKATPHFKGSIARVRMEVGPPWIFSRVGTIEVHGLSTRRGALLVVLKASLDEPRTLELSFGPPYSPIGTFIAPLPQSLPLRWASLLDCVNELWPTVHCKLLAWD